MNHLTLIVGPPGSGKSTLAKQFVDNDHSVYINQDKQGKAHLDLFDAAIHDGRHIVVDRMNFDVKQRKRYLDVARNHGYETHIVVIHQSYQICLERMLARENHETVKNEENARAALKTFFTKYERVQDDEADNVVRVWPEGPKPLAVICDLDGTLCDLNHRLHFVRGEKGTRDWPSFFYNLRHDTPHEWCRDLVTKFAATNQIVYCSGRPDSHRPDTDYWLKEHGLDLHGSHLYMRHRADHREDSIVKEILLDFEILTRFTPYFAIDDRARVVQMWRKRGIVTLACHEGNF